MKRLLLTVLTFLFLISPVYAAQRSVTVEWGYDNAPSDLAGFVLYKDGVKIATFNDPIARSFSGDLDLNDADACYTLTAIDTGGGETPHSTCYHYDPAPDGAPTNLRVTVVVDVEVQVQPQPQ